MAEKHLGELLKEDQEPFLLKHYIWERRSHLNNKPTNFTTLKNSPLRPSNSNTAALLLQAALRIHKPNPKPNTALGFLGSFFKRLLVTTSKTKWRETEIEVVGSCEVAFTCSCNAIATTTTTTAHHTTPPSPTPHIIQDKEINGGDDVNKFQSGEEEEDKEQCSPVSILDPPFDDDDDENDHDGEHGFDLDCSYANVQRTKQHLLDRLRRFEKLAELDPVELETRMLDEEDCEYETFNKEDEYDDVDSETSEENVLSEKVFEILCHESSAQDIQQTPEDLKKLVYDLIKEQETEVNSSEESNNMVVIRSVCRRLELWKEVKFNTIDMMIEGDFCREEGGWKKNAELAGELELAIFCVLVDELLEELVC